MLSDAQVAELLAWLLHQGQLAATREMERVFVHQSQVDRMGLPAEATALFDLDSDDTAA